MIETQVLLPIVLGLGVAVMSSPLLTRFGGDRSQSPATFFVLATQLLGFAVFGMALYLALHELALGHRDLSGENLKAEVRLIAALALLFVLMAFRGALRVYIAPADRPSWQVGVFDRVTPLLMFTLGITLCALFELAVVVGIAETAHTHAGRALFAILGVLLVGVGGPMMILRLLVGVEVSPEAFVRSRREQQKLLEKLDGAEGAWVQIVVRAAVEVTPSEAFRVCLWSTPRGWYWRVADGWTLARFHAWAANHAVTPTPALHMQRMSVFGGVGPAAMRGMRLTETTRRLWPLDVWRSHRQQRAAPEDGAEPERAAGLVYISHQQLQDAGLTVVIEPAKRVGERRTDDEPVELQRRPTAV